MRKKIISLLCFLLVVSSLFSFQSSTASASDIDGITLENEMREMIKQGIMKGYNDGEYKPSIDVSRGQFATMISRALNLPAGTPSFSDVPQGSSLAAGINSASKAGIVSGYGGGIFGINDPITREQMAKMIDNSLVYLKITRTAASLSIFTDGSDIQETFKKAVANTVNDGIIRGIKNDDGTTYKFLPAKTATRAESAAVLFRMMNIAHIGHDNIMGNSVISAEKLAAFVKAQNPDAQDIDEIAAAFIEIGQKYGVRGDIAFCQSIIETGWFGFDDGTAVTPDQHNYGGLGVTSKGVKGNEFATVELGVTAQIQHLYGYASTNALPDGEPVVDERFEILEQYNLRGKAPHWEDLGMRWAMSEFYGFHILSLYDQLKSY